MSSTKKFSIRAWVSLVLVFTFIALAVSGAILYFAPPCSVADSINWSVLALSKDQWSALHVVTSIAFLVTSLVHLLVYNWGPLMNYIKQKAPSRFPVRRELVAAVVVALLLFGGAISGIAPFGTLMDWQDDIKDYYRGQAPGRGDGRGMGRQTAVPRADELPAEPAAPEASEETARPVTRHGANGWAHRAPGPHRRPHAAPWPAWRPGVENRR